MIDLKDIRVEIDAIDEQIQKLFEKRMDLAKSVAEYKIRTGMPVFDKERELQKLKVFRERANNDFNAHGIQELFQQIMGMSRKFQYRLLAEQGILDPIDFEEIEALETKGMKVVYQGVEGAYSHAATRQFFGKNVDCFHVNTWRDAMEAIKNEEAAYGVLPIENSTAGSVYDNYDLLNEYDHQIVGEQLIQCRHVLMGVPGARVSDIKYVYSHPQALMQCREYLRHHEDWRQLEYSNTALAAKKVSQDVDFTQAAIGSRHAAEVFGLDVLEEGINDKLGNSTRFIIVAKKKVFVRNADKISICLELPHESGSLYNILSHFIYNDLNMTRIESRPIPEKDWEYRFFIDFEGNLNDSAVKNALGGISQEASWLRVIGNYKREG